MPIILDKLVNQLEVEGRPQSSAYAIATNALQKAGELKKGTNKPTKKGVERGQMTSKQREDSRQKAYANAKASTK